MQEKLLVYWLWLVMIMGVANQNTIPLIRKYPDPEELYHLMQNPDCQFLKDKYKKRVLQNPLAKAEKVLSDCKEKQIGILTWNSEYYPDYLRHIYNPPALLFYKGSPAFLKNENLFTVVGTRRPSEYSMRVAERICPELVSNGLTLVSGCAVGLDAVAHQAAVNKNRPTIGVLGCGIDCNYPKENMLLKEKITENGLLLTEYFPGTPPYGGNFPVRNRILSGISKAVLVIEAGQKSGCMITATLACEQGKQVFCIPPADIYQQRYSGQSALIRDGAFPVFGTEDILQLINFQQEVCQTEEEIREKTEPETVSESIADTSELDGLSEQEQQILSLLWQGEKNVNMLCDMMGMKFETLSMHIIELEMMGWIVSTGRDFYTTSEKYHGKHSA